MSDWSRAPPKLELISTWFRARQFRSLLKGDTMSKQKTAEQPPKTTVSQNGQKRVEKRVKPTVSQNGPKTVEKRIKPAVKPQDGPKPAVKPDEPKFVKFQGLLQEFNLSPKGGIEGFLLHSSDGQTVQVNVTPECFLVLTGRGKNVEATVEPETLTNKRRKGDHPVYRLITLKGEDGNVLVFANRDDGEVVTVQGIVKRINYTRYGEADGVVLESGEFIHLKPEGMKHARLKVADQVTATGPASLMPLGQQVIEATTVNGVAVTSNKPRVRT
jgi:hypothetical protein